ncbi:MAG: hypothetical protein QXE05_09530 [Nitrososphaeria archaeon]
MINLLHLISYVRENFERIKKRVNHKDRCATEELKRYNEQLDTVNKALEEMKKLLSPKERR